MCSLVAVPRRRRCWRRRTRAPSAIDALRLPRRDRRRRRRRPSRSPTDVARSGRQPAWQRPRCPCRGRPPTSRTSTGLDATVRVSVSVQVCGGHAHRVETGSAADVELDRRAEPRRIGRAGHAGADGEHQRGDPSDRSEPNARGKASLKVRPPLSSLRRSHRTLSSAWCAARCHAIALTCRSVHPTLAVGGKLCRSSLSRARMCRRSARRPAYKRAAARRRRRGMRSLPYARPGMPSSHLSRSQIVSTGSGFDHTCTSSMSPAKSRSQVPW